MHSIQSTVSTTQCPHCTWESKPQACDAKKDNKLESALRMRPRVVASPLYFCLLNYSTDSYFHDFAFLFVSFMTKLQIWKTRWLLLYRNSVGWTNAWDTHEKDAVQVELFGEIGLKSKWRFFSYVSSVTSTAFSSITVSIAVFQSVLGEKLYYQHQYWVRNWSQI